MCTESEGQERLDREQVCALVAVMVCVACGDASSAMRMPRIDRCYTFAVAGVRMVYVVAV